MSKIEYGTLRIIAGQWRGRKIQFPALPGLRPSPDRLRETLFNWLMPYIQGLVCLDLFAGSGILSFEALSRGAAGVVAIDQSPIVIAKLKETAKILNANQLESICATWPKLPAFNNLFDLVFLDPPFNLGLVEPCCDWLEKNNLLKPSAWIYIECERGGALPKVPDNWVLFREMQTQQVRAMLYSRVSIK